MVYNTHLKQQHELLLYFVDGISFEGESLKHGTIVPPNAFIENVWERARTGLNFAATAAIADTIGKEKGNFDNCITQTNFERI